MLLTRVSGGRFGWRATGHQRRSLSIWSSDVVDAKIKVLKGLTGSPASQEGTTQYEILQECMKYAMTSFGSASFPDLSGLTSSADMFNTQHQESLKSVFSVVPKPCLKFLESCLDLMTYQLGFGYTSSLIGLTVLCRGALFFLSLRSARKGRTRDLAVYEKDQLFALLHKARGSGDAARVLQAKSLIAKHVQHTGRGPSVWGVGQSLFPLPFVAAMYGVMRHMATNPYLFPQMATESGNLMLPSLLLPDPTGILPIAAVACGISHLYLFSNLNSTGSLLNTIEKAYYSRISKYSDHTARRPRASANSDSRDSTSSSSSKQGDSNRIDSFPDRSLVDDDSGDLFLGRYKRRAAEKFFITGGAVGALTCGYLISAMPAGFFVVLLTNTAVGWLLRPILASDRIGAVFGLPPREMPAWLKDSYKKDIDEFLKGEYAGVASDARRALEASLLNARKQSVAKSKAYS